MMLIQCLANNLRKYPFSFIGGVLHPTIITFFPLVRGGKFSPTWGQIRLVNFYRLAKFYSAQVKEINGWKTWQLFAELILLVKNIRLILFFLLQILLICRMNETHRVVVSFRHQYVSLECFHGIKKNSTFSNWVYKIFRRQFLATSCEI